MKLTEADEIKELKPGELAFFAAYRHTDGELYTNSTVGTKEEKDAVSHTAHGLVDMMIDTAEQLEETK